MNVLLIAQASTITADSTISLGFICGAIGSIVTVAVIIGETRWQVSHLREWRRAMDAELEAMRVRLTAIEVREGRTLERLDAMDARLNRIEQKLDRLLERRESA